MLDAKPCVARLFSSLPALRDAVQTNLELRASDKHLQGQHELRILYIQIAESLSADLDELKRYNLSVVL